MATVALYDFAKKKALWRRGLGALTAVYAVAFVADNVALFPYNYVYFNGVGRQVADQSNFDLEYWAFSSKEVGSIVNRLSGSRSNVWVRVYPHFVVSPYLRPGISFASSPNELPPQFKGGYLTIVWSRMKAKPDAGCEKAATINRKLPLSSKTLEMVYLGLCTKT
jgi:hypothetical protein